MPIRYLSSQKASMESEIENVRRTDEPPTRASFRERNKFMVNNNLLSDVTFIVKDSDGDKEITVYAHKYVLAVGSPVFFTMFYGALATEGAQEIHLPDCDADSFKEFLSFLYCDEVCICEDTVIQLLYLAKKYMVPSLHEMAKKRLHSMINATSVFEILPLILHLDEDDLVDQCWKVIDIDTEQAINQDSFYEIERDLLEKVLERDELTIREVNLFGRVLDWAKVRQNPPESDGKDSNIRDILGEKIIRLLRFSTMSFNEFTCLVSTTGVLNEKEVSAITQFYQGFCQEIPKEFCESFPRGKIFRCNRFSNVSDTEVLPRKRKWSYKRGYEDSIRFSVEASIVICGIRLFGFERASYYVELSMYHTSRKSNSCRHDRDACHLPSFSTAGIFQSEEDSTSEYHGFDVLVDPPFYLKHNTDLIVQVIMQGPKSDFGEGGKMSLDCEGVRFHFENERSRNGTTAKIGQFAEIIFKTDL